MSNIIFESNKGIVFEQTIKNGRCRLDVKHKDFMDYSHMTYYYNNVPGLDSPYVNWDNLNCVGGWTYDETYLHTAVQQNRKLYAGIVLSYHADDQTAKQLNEKLLKTLRQEMPSDCVIGNELPAEHSNGPYKFQHKFICKTGTIADYINLIDVFETYNRLGILLDDKIKGMVTKACNMKIHCFATNSPFDYGNVNTDVEYIVAGLLLGYPLETTAWLINM